jgi:16S rRNA A1518/A1519 N6-dimethyltransferase RsmA/KsgA/DIM1 with predicted DNA glycosylase/AP lyase activity
MFKLTEINFGTSTLLVGKKFAHLISSGPDSPNFTRMSLLANAYFNVKLITEVPKSDFEPMPRANGHIIMLTPKTPKQIGATEQAFRSIVEASRNNTTIAHALKSVNLGNNKATNKQSLGKKSLSHHKRHLSTQLCKNLAQQYNTNDNFTPTNVDKFKKVTETNSLNLLIKAGIDQTILSKPLTGISNHDLRKICQTISSIDNKYRTAHKDSDQSR